MSTQKANKNNKSETKTIRFEHELVSRIDADRGDVPFAAWVKRSCINRLVQGDSECIDTGVQVVTALDLTDEDYKNMEVLKVIEDLAVNRNGTCLSISNRLNSLNFKHRDKDFTETSVKSLLRTKLRRSNIK